MLAFGPYVVEAELGRGAAGVVYRARGPQGEVVALKVLVPRHGDERQARRVAREVRVLERLRHPGIVAVRAAGEVRGGLWIAMDLVDGQTLQRRLDTGGPLAPREAAALVLELARALAHAHAEGVLHRDLKPDNVLLDRAGRPFLTDFGLAKDLEGSLHGASLSVTGQFMGTPGYWPPEQARGERGAIGPASDVYALGATLFAALTGGPPYAAESLIEALAAAERAPPAPSSRNPDVPPALDAVVARCLRPAVEDRYASADDLARALEGFLAGARARRRPRRRWPLALVGGAGAAPLLVGGVPPGGEAPARAEPAPTTTAPAEPVAAEGASPGQAAMLEVLREAKRRGVEVDDTAAFLTVFDAMPPEVLATDDVAGWRATTHVLRALERRVANDPAWRDDAVAAVGLARGRTTSAARLALARALSNLEEHGEALATFEGLLDDPGVEDRAHVVRAMLAACREALPALRGAFLRRGAASAHAPDVIAALERAAALDDPAVEAERADVLVTLARALVIAGTTVARVTALLDRASADPRGRLARAEWRLARGELDGAAQDLASARAPDAEARVAALEELLAVERLAERRGVESVFRAHDALGRVAEVDLWARDVREHLRRRRAAALLLPAIGEDRPLTPAELDRLVQFGGVAADHQRTDVFLALADELPASARAQPDVRQARAMAHASRAARADTRAAARAEREAALALLTPAEGDTGHHLRADVLYELERWDEALTAYGEALRLQPALAELARERVLVAAERAWPASAGSFLHAEARLSRGAGVLDVLVRLTPEGEPPSPARAVALARLARARHAAGDGDGAAEAMRRAAREGADVAEVLLTRAEWHLAAGRLDDALADLRAAPRSMDLPPTARFAAQRLQQVIMFERALALGDRDAARLVAQSLSQDLEGAGGPWCADLRAHAEALRARTGS